MSREFEKKSEGMERIWQALQDIMQKLLLNDTSMATLFKMLRMQYALVH